MKKYKGRDKEMVVQTKSISRYDAVIDTRDVLDRIKELRKTHEDRTELAALKALIKEIRALGFGDSPEDGITLIRDSYFEEYAEEVARDIGAISQDVQWPQGCIDWKAAAEELQIDYTEIDFDGTTYWAR